MEAISKNLSTINQEESEQLIKYLLSTVGDKRIFLVGSGRSGLVARSFATRLMHLGFNVSVIGETTTPPLRKGDVLIAVSGSGETTYPLTVAKEAKKLGARIVAVTSFPDSPLGKTADLVVKIGGRVPAKETKDYVTRQLSGEHEPLTPMGTLFELSTSIFFDALIAELAFRMGKKEEDLRARHATVE